MKSKFLNWKKKKLATRNYGKLNKLQNAKKKNEKKKKNILA